MVVVRDQRGTLLDLLIHQRAHTTTPCNAWRLVAPQHATGQGSAIEVYRLDVQLTALELVDDTARSIVIAELTRITAGTADAALARTVLTHPARRHLPAPLLEQLATVHALATTPTTAESLHTAHTNALAGLPPGSVHSVGCAAPEKSQALPTSARCSRTITSADASRTSINLPSQGRRP